MIHAVLASSGLSGNRYKEERGAALPCAVEKNLCRARQIRVIDRHIDSDEVYHRISGAAGTGPVGSWRLCQLAAVAPNPEASGPYVRTRCHASSSMVVYEQTVQKWSCRGLTDRRPS